MAVHRVVASDPLPTRRTIWRRRQPCPHPKRRQLRASLDSGPILLHWQGDVAVVTLNRPDKLNSFTRDMHRALVTALDHVEAGGARALC
jgi:2-(1,2-epoxy-1,2-dihydrophenyl)acetyl-CoA isomerase